MTFLTQGCGFTLDSSFEDFQPKRFGLSFNPPKIVLEYIVPSTGKLYLHNMRLSNLDADDDPQKWSQYLCKKHSMYLPPNKVDPGQIRTLVVKLQENLGRGEESSDIYSDEDIIL